MDFDIKCGLRIEDDCVDLSNGLNSCEIKSHESATLATFTTELKEFIQNDDVVKSVIRNRKVYYIVNNLFGVFKDVEFSSSIFTHFSRVPIDVFCVDNKSSVYLFLRNGFLEVFTTVNGNYHLHGELKLSENEEFQGIFFQNAFEVESEGMKFIVVVLKNGRILRVNISELPITFQLLEDLNESVSVSAFSNPFLFTKCSRKVSVLNTKTLCLKSTKMCTDIKSAHFIKSNGMILVLLHNGTLIEFCPFTLLHFPVESCTEILNRMLVFTDDNCSVQHITGISNSNNLLQFDSGFSLIYSLKIHGEIHMITPEHKDDELIYISVIKNENLCKFDFRNIYETNPVKKLENLLRKKMFAEAEQYACIHKLDFDIIRKEKTKLIVEKRCVDSSDIDELLHLFGDLKDIHFVLKCTERISCEKPEDYLKLLEFCAKIRVENENFAGKQLAVCKENFRRFKIFIMLGFEMEKWAEFSKNNLICVVKSFLAGADVEKATLVLSRMSITERNSLDLTCVHEILELLSSNIDFRKIASFFTLFMSISTEVVPESGISFVEWFEKRIRENQHSNDEFPTKYIEFLNLNSNLMNLCDTVRKLYEHMRNINTLQEKYYIKMTLKDIEKEPKEVVRFLLDSQLPVDTYNDLLNDFIDYFILKHNLDPNEIFWNELMHKLNGREECWIEIVQSILARLKTEELVLNGIVEIVSRSSLPYSKSVRKLIKNKLPELSHLDLSDLHAFFANEAVLIVMEKYNSKDEDFFIDFTNIFDFEHSVQRMIQCNLQSLEEDVMVLCRDKWDFHVEALKILFCHFVELGSLQRASQVLTGDETILKKSLEGILSHFKCMLNFSIDKKKRENFISALDVITEKYQQNLSVSKFEYANFSDVVKKLKSAHFLNNHYKVKIEFEENTAKLKRATMDGLIREVLEKFENNHMDTVGIAKLFRETRELSLHFRIEWEELIIMLSTRFQGENIQIFLKEISVNFLESTESSKYLGLLSVLILHNLCEDYAEASFENTFVGDTTMLVPGNQVDIELLKYAKELAEKAVINAETFTDITACTNIIQWTDSIYFLKRKTNVELGEQHHQGYFEDFLCPSVVSLAAIKKLFSIFSMFVVSAGCSEKNEFKLITYFMNTSRNIKPISTLLEELETFKLVACVMQNDGDVLLLHKLLTTLKNQLNYHEIYDKKFFNALNDLLENFCNDDFLKMCINDVHENFLQISMMNCSIEILTEKIRRALQYNRKSPENIAVIAKVGRNVSNFLGNQQFEKFCENVLLNVAWYHKTKHLNYEYYKFFVVNEEERLNMLMEKENFDHNLIKPYCYDYKLTQKIQEFHSNFLKITLLNWKPKYVIIGTEEELRKLAMESCENSLYEKCSKIIENIDDKKSVCRALTETWSKVNFYYYEVFKVILQILGDFKDNTHSHIREMLFFLSKYTRTNPPGDVELEKWAEISPNCPTIDPLSEFRILFNITVLESKEVRNILKNEVTLKNCSLWLDAVHIFNNFNTDDVCWFLIYGIVDRGEINTKSQSDRWIISMHDQLFAEIDKHLKRMISVEHKIAATYHLFSNIPEGADKVTFGKIMYEYAKENESEINSDVFSKIEKNYKRCLALKVLHAFGLNNSKCVDLVNNIEELLKALYSDERIVERSIENEFHLPDINEASNQLAQIFSYDITKFRLNLMKTCLENSHVETSCFTLHDNNFKTAIYLCQSDIEYWRNYLCKESVVSNDNNKDTYYFQWRSLKCLQEISDVETMKKMFNCSYEFFEKILEKYQISHVLSQFGISVEKVKSWSTVMKQLSIVGNAKSVRAQAVVCKIKADKPKYWKYIIKKALQLEMFDELEDYLMHVASNEVIVNEGFYVDSWQALIEHNFASNLKLQSDGACFEKKMLKDLLLVQSCSVLPFLKLDEIFGEFVIANENVYAAILSQYASHTRRYLFIKELKTSNKYGELLVKLESFQSRGVVIFELKNLLKCS